MKLMTPFFFAYFIVALMPYSTQAQVSYWYDTFVQNIWRFDPNGENLERIYPDNQLEVLTGMAIDTKNGHIYISQRRFTNDPDGTPGIFRMNLNGTELTEIMSSDSNIINSIQIDTEGEKLYWLESAPQRVIKRANLDGSDVTTLFTTTDNSLYRLDVQAASNKLYWTVNAESEIWEANLDGSNPKLLISSSTFGEFYRDVAILDSMIYWTVQGSVFGDPASKIMRAKLDGTEIQTLVDLGTDPPHGITIDPTAKKVYWTVENQGERIQRMDPDGSNVENWFVAEDVINPNRIGEIGGVEFDFGGLIASQQEVQETIQIQLFPNPSKGQLQINLPEHHLLHATAEFIIYNNLGQPLIKLPYDGFTRQLSVQTQLPAGLFHLVLQEGDKVLHRQTFVVAPN